MPIYLVIAILFWPFTFSIAWTQGVETFPGEEVRERSVDVSIQRYSEKEIKKSLEYLAEHGSTTSLKKNAEVLLSEVNRKGEPSLGSVSVQRHQDAFAQCRSLAEAYAYSDGNLESDEKLVLLRACVDWSLDSKSFRTMSSSQIHAFLEKHYEKRKDGIGDDLVRSVENLPKGTEFDTTRFQCLNDRVQCIASGESKFVCALILGRVHN